jgi:hypothetical protein
VAKLFKAQGRAIANEISKLGARRATTMNYARPVYHADRGLTKQDHRVISIAIDKVLDSTAPQWTKVLRKQISGALQIFGAGEENGGLYDLAVGIDSKLYNKAAADYVSKRLPKITGPIKTTTREKVSALVQKGIQNGDSIQETAVSIRDLFSDMSVYRSELIAQVETGIGASTGDFINARLTDLDLLKVWSTAEDDKVRDSHVEVNDTVAEMDELFANDMLFPLWEDGPIEEIANCRCACLYVPRDEIGQWV